MWRIAHDHGVDIESIKRANPQLDIDHITVGDKILVPGSNELKKNPAKPKLNVQKWVSTTKRESKPVSKTPEKKQVSNRERPSFTWPYRGPVISSFGMHNLKMHNGIDIQVPSGAMIVAAAPGKVAYAGDQIEGYDRILILLHDKQLFTIYAFVGDFVAKEGQIVQSGTPIARARFMMPKSFFHFEIRHIKTSLDPQKLLN